MIWLMGRNKNLPEKIRTFTYYIPAPPTRRSGYREKEFDKLMADIVDLGFSIKSLATQSHTGENSSGMWVICQLTGDERSNWNQLDNLADPLPKEKEDYHHSHQVSAPELVESEKLVDLPEISEEEAQEQLANLYTIDDEEQKK